MASIGLKINDGSSTGINSGVADVFAKALFGDPEAAAKIALVKAQIATQGAAATKYGTASALDLQQAQTQITERERLHAEAVNANASAAKSQAEMDRANKQQQAQSDAAAPLSDVYIKSLNKPHMVTTQRPPEMMGRMPAIVAPDPHEQALYDAQVAAAPALARNVTLNEGTDPAGQMGKFQGTAGLSIPDPANVRTNSILYTGKDPSATDVLMPGDTTGIDAHTKSEIAINAAKPHEAQIITDKLGNSYQVLADPDHPGQVKQVLIPGRGMVIPEPYAGDTPEAQAKNHFIAVAKALRDGQPITPEAAEAFTLDHRLLYGTKAVTSRNADGSENTSFTKEQPESWVPDPDKVLAAAGAKPQPPVVQQPVVQPPQPPQPQSQMLQPEKPFVPSVEQPGVATPAAPKIALQPGVIGTPGAPGNAGAFGGVLNVGGQATQAPVPVATPAAPVVASAAVPQASVNGQATVANTGAPATQQGPVARWSHYVDTTPKQEVITSPDGKTTVTRVKSGTATPPTPTAENTRDFTNLRGTVDSLEYLDHTLPKDVPSGWQQTLNNFANGGTPISQDMIESIVDKKTRDYARAVFGVINGIARRESGAVVNPDEWRNYRMYYSLPPNASEEEYDSVRKSRMQMMLGIRESLDGRIPDEKLRELDDNLMKHGVNLLYGEQELPEGVDKSPPVYLAKKGMGQYGEPGSSFGSASGSILPASGSILPASGSQAASGSRSRRAPKSRRASARGPA